MKVFRGVVEEYFFNKIPYFKFRSTFRIALEDALNALI
jgi:hypothetical protein